MKYLELSRHDAEAFAPDAFVHIPCPGCGGYEVVPRLEKTVFRYVICAACGSLFCDPRPGPDLLDRFYGESESSKYWAETFFPAIAEARREKIFRKRASRLSELLKAHNFTPDSICDVGAGYGIFLEELKSFFPESTLSAIEPGTRLASMCREKGFTTLEASVEHASEWHGRFSLVVCSEVIEHVFSTEDFLRSIYLLLKPGGYALITGLGFEGFYILSLMENSDSISPPHHLNFLSLAGFERLFVRTGFSSVEVMTPGELDVDIVRNNPQKTEFVRALEKRGDVALQEFQAFLKKHRLSSHVWILANRS